MPIYEYNCEHCSYKFDKLVMSHTTDVKCPLCQKGVKKRMSTFSVGHDSNPGGTLPPGVGPKMCTNC